MDTKAYLTSQGWLGNGHSLNSTARGLKKPLLVSRKSNTLGIGLKEHGALADQWWARAFDKSLKGLDVSTNEITGDTNTVTAGAWGELDMVKTGGAKWVGNGGLYAGFIKGEGLAGTAKIGREEVDGGRSQNTNMKLESRANMKRKRKKDPENAAMENEELKRRRATKAKELGFSKEEQRAARRLQRMAEAKAGLSNGEPVGIQVVGVSEVNLRKKERRRARQSKLRNPPERTCDEEEPKTHPLSKKEEQTQEATFAEPLSIPLVKRKKRKRK